MSYDPDTEGPTCPVCGEWLRPEWRCPWFCEACDEEAERLEARAAEQPDIAEEDL